MARTDAASNESSADALSILMRDHRMLAGMIREFDDAANEQLDPLARRLCKLLRVHSQIKEEIFYPAARRVSSDSAAINKVENEQAEIRQSIMLIDSLDSDDTAFAAAVATLAEEVNAVIATEVDDLFPEVRASGIDLLSIGILLADRRATLMEVLGLHGDDEKAAIDPAQPPAIARSDAQRRKER